MSQTGITTPSQAKSILTAQLNLLKEQPQLAQQLPPIMLWGAPGIGKSSIIQQVCHEQKVEFIDIRLSQREPVDLRGLPVPKQDHVDWLLAGEWPRDPKSRGIILFDEITAADRSLQVAAYELILDRRLGNLYTLPDGWLVVAAGNRLTDKAVANSFSSALANRFCHLNVDADIDAWVRWASSSRILPDIIGFLRFSPDRFFDMKGNIEQGWPSPRSWARVSYVLSSLEDRLDKPALNAMIEGLVGKGATTELLAFRELAHQLPDIKAMLNQQSPISIPERPDQCYAFCSSLSYYLWEHGLNVSEAHIEQFFAISQQLTSDFATLALIDAINDEDLVIKQQKMLKLMGHPAFNQWAEQHGKIFNQLFSEAA